MKNLTFSSLLFVLSFSVHSQVAFYDAQLVDEFTRNKKISIDTLFVKYKDRNNQDTIVIDTKIDLYLKLNEIRKGKLNGSIEDAPEYYINLSESEAEQLDYLRKFIDNPFSDTLNYILDFRIIRNALIKGEETLLDIEKRKNARPHFGGGSIFTFGGMLISTLSKGINSASQTKLYDGFTKYIAEEFKEGSTNAYLELLERYLDRIGEFRILFPETCENLQKYGPFEFSDLGNELKITLVKDLKSMPINLLHHLEDTNQILSRFSSINFTFLTHSNVNSIRSHDEYRWVKIGLDIGDKVINGQHPVNIIEHLDRSYYDTLYGDFRFIFRGLNLIQSNLRDTSKIVNGQNDNVWVNYEQIKQMTPDEWYYFFAILHNQDTAIYNSVFPAATIASASSLFNEKIKPVYESLLEIQEFARSQNQEKKDVPNYVRLILKTITKINTIRYASIDDKDTISQAIVVLENCTDIYVSIKENNFSTTIQHISNLMEVLLNTISIDKNSNTDFARFISGFNKLGKFAVSVSNTENSDDLKDVIKQFAADPSSYEGKRASNFGIAVNSFPGFYTSIEKFDGVNQKWKGNVGISLPVGIEIYSGFSRLGSNDRYNIFVRDSEVRHLTGYSFSVLFQVVDLGAILNYRLTDSESELPDDIDFNDIFSPGIIANFGFKNTPLTLSAGYQYAPKLREIGGGRTPNADRILLKLSWDIPVVHIINRKQEEVSKP